MLAKGPGAPRPAKIRRPPASKNTTRHSLWIESTTAQRVDLSGFHSLTSRCTYTMKPCTYIRNKTHPVTTANHYLYIHYIHTYIHTYMHACMHACIHTYIRTYSTYTHIYMYIPLRPSQFSNPLTLWVIERVDLANAPIL